MAKNSKKLWVEQGLEEQGRIAEELEKQFQIKVHQTTVGRDLQAIKDRMVAQTTDDIKAFVIAGYQYTWSQAIIGWQRSLENKEVQIQESVENPRKSKDKDTGADRIKAQLRTEGQSGNPAFLAQAQAALKSLRELWGLDAPTKIDITWQRELMDLLRAGLITEQDIIDEFGGDIAQDFFESVGLNFAGIREIEEESPAE
jgi:hypothetical protein